MSTGTQLAEWLSREAGSKRLGVNPSTFDRILEAGKIRVRHYPNTKPKFHAGDIEAIALQSIRNAESAAAAS